MNDAVKMAIERIKARFHPHYGIDGASDSKQLASDCQTLIAALEQAGEPVEWRPIDTAPVDGSAFIARGRDWGHADGRFHYNRAKWSKTHKEWLSADDDDQSLAYLTDWLCKSPAGSPLPTLQRLGQEFDAGEAVEAMRAACIAAVRAEKKYEGSDFPVCNAIVREIEAIPAHPAPKALAAGEGLTVADAWQDLVDKDDRTSPEEYPDMALITREELADYMSAAAPSKDFQS